MPVLSGNSDFVLCFWLFSLFYLSYYFCFSQYTKSFLQFGYMVLVYGCFKRVFSYILQCCFFLGTIKCASWIFHRKDIYSYRDTLFFWIIWVNIVIELSIELQGAIFFFLFRTWASHLLRELSYIYCFLKWFCSLKHQSYSRAYIDFKKPEDVIEFAEFFDGHLFVNEKGNLCPYLLKRFDYSNQSCCQKFCDYLFIHTTVWIQIG